jgi:2,3-bisphosphoglycerate-independent phosphoglycerate mutase
MRDNKFAIVILDGASGKAVESFGGLTSLEAARTPGLDAMAREGMVGLAKNVPDGMEPSSNIACTSICGYDPSCYKIGRGAIEGAACGIDLADDEVAMRLNLTHVSEDGMMVSYSTDNISSADGNALIAELAQELNDDAFTLHPGVGFRGILVVKGHPELLATTFKAAHDMTDEHVADYPATGPGAALIEDYRARARKLLAASPVNQRRRQEGRMTANEVFAFWPGSRPQGMEPFEKAYGLMAGMLSGVDLLCGIARLAEMRIYHFPGVTDGPDNDYAAQANGALSMLDECDIVFVHVEAPDAEGHDGNAAGKKAAIEAIDREIIARLLAYAQDHPLRILALPDHPTPVGTKRHTADLVPFVLWGPGIEANGASRLTEKQAAATGLVADPGHTLLRKLLRDA